MTGRALTPIEAKALADRIHAEVTRRLALAGLPPSARRVLDADLERIESDLVGLRRHGVPHYCVGRRDRGLYLADGPPCPDRRRYAKNLRRTAALYLPGIGPGPSAAWSIPCGCTYRPGRVLPVQECAEHAVQGDLPHPQLAN